ncbi:hypothetical protein ACHHYP_12316 [Achlya hypogyna]|uniref:RING-type E3 ubiquitin transferase n=1 Tax=Achlya hypogyna TaxID=1202772 RepID=A0A1V9ZHD8_ACHHY|nr:hypothetical protein ACHHYP_12316 [Achlya hypogyna]
MSLATASGRVANFYIVHHADHRGRAPSGGGRESGRLAEPDIPCSMQSTRGGGIQVRTACSRALWIHDSQRAGCNSCGIRFTFYRRRHHCRVCGEVVCRKCTRTVYLVNTASNVGLACIECAIPLASPRSTRPTCDFGVDMPSSWGTRPTCPTFLSSLERLSFDRPPSGCDSECALCIRQLAQGDEAVSLPCHHTFHGGCILPWLTAHDECPTCRHKLPRDATIVPNLFMCPL